MHKLRTLSFLGCLLPALVGAPAAGNAQSFFSFFWEGGSREVVRFDPRHAPGQIIVSFGDRRLYHITKAGQATSYPIAIPREQSRWQGNTSVSMKRENPDWRPTPDMLKENPRLPSWVPGGHPMNPLGVRALYLGSSLYRIHGTDAPWTIGQDVSKGCIRMFNEDVKHLYPLVPTGTKVVVTWQRFKTNGMAVADSSSSEEAAPAPSAQKKRVAAPKTGFFVIPAANASETEAEAASDTTALDSDEGLVQDEEATVFIRNADGGYVKQGDEAGSVEGPASENKKVTRYNRRVGGTVSRSSQEKSALE